MNELEYNREESSGSESMLKAMQDQGATYREEDLATNLDWIEASGKVYQMNNDGEKFAGDHRALAQYGIDQMSEFNYNVAMGMIPDVLAVEKADPETQMSFAYLMDTYDKKDITLDGFGRATLNAVIDPTNWLGVSTLGAGFALKKGVQELAKEGLKNRLHNSIRNYLTSGLAVGATEGAIYSAGDTTAREMIQTDAGLREGVSGTDVGVSAVAGGIIGAGIGKGVEIASPYVVKGVKAVGRQVGKGIDYINREGEQAMAQVAGGGTPKLFQDELAQATNKPNQYKQQDDMSVKRTDVGDRVEISGKSPVDGEVDTNPLVRMIKPKGEFEGVGTEKGTVKENGISLLKSEYGSYRYVYSKNGEIISALQVVSKDGKEGEIANAYTTPYHRRTGKAKELYNKAKADFKVLKHSSDLSEEGKKFKDGVEAK